MKVKDPSGNPAVFAAAEKESYANFTTGPHGNRPVHATWPSSESSAPRCSAPNSLWRSRCLRCSCPRRWPTVTSPGSRPLPRVSTSRTRRAGDVRPVRHLQTGHHGSRGDGHDHDGVPRSPRWPAATPHATPRSPRCTRSWSASYRCSPAYRGWASSLTCCPSRYW